MNSNPYLRKFFATRRRLAIWLVIASALGGAVMGAVLTVLGKILAGAPPATAGNYLWNMGVFAVIAAGVGPTVIWSALRRAPLWRTVAEPLAAGVAAAGLALLTGWGVGLLLLPPIAAVGAATRLSYAHRKKHPALPGGRSALVRSAPEHRVRPGAA